jgi:Contractile injection system tube protein
VERVAFLIEETGERIACMLNPEDMVVRRLAGVRPRRSAGGALTGAGLADDPLLFTGGGTTELHLNLLFDVSLGGSSTTVADVRELTYPLWQLAENAADERNYGRPPLVRFVWGKSWNIPGIVSAVAERLDYFSSGGEPLRSWLSMRFLRVAESASAVLADRPPLRSLQLPEEVTPQPSTQTGTTPTESSGPEFQVHQIASGERLDQLEFKYYGYLGHPSLWRWLAIINDVVDPLHIAPGTPLQIPPLSHIYLSPKEARARVNEQALEEPR